jgi:hypothetical protein
MDPPGHHRSISSDGGKGAGSGLKMEEFHRIPPIAKLVSWECAVTISDFFMMLL